MKKSNRVIIEKKNVGEPHVSISIIFYEIYII